MGSIIVVGFFVFVLYSILFMSARNKEKVDKGKVKNYFRLSYRRRFIRTLWTFVLALILLIPLYIFSGFTLKEFTLFSIFIILIFLTELIYSLIRWKAR